MTPSQPYEEELEWLRLENARLKEESERLWDALEDYGAHHPACMAGHYKPRTGLEPYERQGPCDCGLDALLDGREEP